MWKYHNITTVSRPTCEVRHLTCMWCRSVKFTLRCRMPVSTLPCSTQQTHAQEVFFFLDLLLDHPEEMERWDEWQHILLERFVWSWDVQGKSCWCVSEWFIVLWSSEWWCRCRCYQKYKCQIFLHQRRWWGMENGITAADAQLFSIFLLVYFQSAAPKRC